MVYNIIITDEANSDLDNIINYILSTFDSTQAAKNILDDYEGTKERLSLIADGLKSRTDISPAFHQLHTIRFKHHKYVAVYALHDGKVIILGILHSSQDIKSRLTEINSTLRFN